MSPDPASAPSSSPALHLGRTSLSNEQWLPLLRRHQLLPELLRRERLAQALADIEIAPADLDAAQAAWLSSRSLEPAQLEEALANQGQTVEGWRQQLQLTLQRNRFLEEQFGHRVDNRFLQVKTQLDQVVYGLIRHSSPGLLQELYHRIADEGEDFASLARQYSQGPERDNGGRVGPCSLAQPHPTLVDILRSCRPGQVYPPVQVNNTWLLVQLQQLLPANPDQHRSTLLQQLCDEWLNQEIQPILDALTPQT